MREGLMRILIRLETNGGLEEWSRQVKEEYKEWGEKPYYLPQPPRNWLKRGVLKTALKLRGPKAVGRILRAYKEVVPTKSKAGTATPTAHDYERSIQRLRSV
jgi:hypothetical protein